MKIIIVSMCAIFESKFIYLFAYILSQFLFIISSVGIYLFIIFNFIILPNLLKMYFALTKKIKRNEHLSNKI